MTEIKQITQDEYPCKKLIFKYKSIEARGRLVRSSKVMLRSAAKKVRPGLFDLPIDCGRECEVLGEMVPVDTLGKFVFGMKRFKACILTVPHEKSFDILLYTNDWHVTDMVLAAAREVGLHYQETERL